MPDASSSTHVLSLLWFPGDCSNDTLRPKRDKQKMTLCKCRPDHQRSFTKSAANRSAPANLVRACGFVPPLAGLPPSRCAIPPSPRLLRTRWRDGMAGPAFAGLRRGKQEGEGQWKSGAGVAALQDLPASRTRGVNAKRRGKAALARAHSKTYRHLGRAVGTRSVVECGTPVALWPSNRRFRPI